MLPKCHLIWCAFHPRHRVIFQRESLWIRGTMWVLLWCIRLKIVTTKRYHVTVTILHPITLDVTFTLLSDFSPVQCLFYYYTTFAHRRKPAPVTSGLHTLPPTTTLKSGTKKPLMLLLLEDMHWPYILHYSATFRCCYSPFLLQLS